MQQNSLQNNGKNLTLCKCVNNLNPISIVKGLASCTDTMKINKYATN